MKAPNVIGANIGIKITIKNGLGCSRPFVTLEERQQQRRQVDNNFVDYGDEPGTEKAEISNLLTEDVKLELWAGGFLGIRSIYWHNVIKPDFTLFPLLQHNYDKPVLVAKIKDKKDNDLECEVGGSSMTLLTINGAKSCARSFR